MEEKKKHIEIHIKMDENEQITPNSKISNVSGDDVIACYLAGAEFSEIHYVYCYHPAVQSKKDIADLWTIGGICLIKDMLPTARRVKEEKCRLEAARTEYERARNRYKELIRWLTNGKNDELKKDDNR